MSNEPIDENSGKAYWQIADQIPTVHHWSATTEMPTTLPDDPIIIDGCGHRHYRQEFHFEGQGFFGRIHASILNWLRRNSD